MGDAVTPLERFNIRPAQKADNVAVRDLYARVIASANWLPPRATRRIYFDQVSQGESVRVCKDRGGELAGFVSVYEPATFIHHLYVDERYRRMGVGTLLLDSLRPRLPLPWTLKCVTANTDALAFYHARGWVVTGTARDENGRYAVMKLLEHRDVAP